jgi:hypothetical protein
MATANSKSVKFPGTQRGAALLILLTIIIPAASYALLKRINREPVRILRAADNSRVLGEAKAALIGYALSAATPTEQPGRLPCPDYGSDGNFDGLSDACDEQANFVTIGRLPWQTLGLSDLHDDAGETLWYSPALELDGNPLHPPINSEITTSLRLDGSARDVAAVIVAPGAVAGNQTRPANLAAQSDPARYLEDANQAADVNFVTVSGSPAADFNDQLTVIYRDELMQAVERRVLGEIKNHLQKYYDANSYYPYAADLNKTDCDSSVEQGHIPVPTVQAGCPSLAEWVDPIPTWFTSQGWNLLVWYAPAPACTQPGPGCTAGGGLIDVANTAAPTGNKQAVLLAAGPVTGVQSRPATGPGDLLDSMENWNKDTSFVKLPIDAVSNDQILIVAP